MPNYRKLAQGRDCEVRIPGHCNGNSETTILAHIGGAGMARKAHDLHGAWCCSGCHAAVDGATQSQHAKDTLELWHLHGVIRTQSRLIEMGLL
jgi:hypothetical protein